MNIFLMKYFSQFLTMKKLLLILKNFMNLFHNMKLYYHLIIYKEF